MKTFHSNALQIAYDNLGKFKINTDPMKKFNEGKKKYWLKFMSVRNKMMGK